MTDTLGPLINFGAVGTVLAWFLFRAESRMERLEGAVERMTRSIMLDLASRPDVSPSIKKQAEQIIQEIEQGAKR